MRGVSIPSSLAVAIGAAGAFFAWRAGGAGELRPSPPREVVAELPATPGATPPGKVKGGAGGEAEEVVVRLIEGLKDARYEAPALRGGLAALEPHWRKMQAPWTGLSGTAAKAALSYALLTSDEEKEYTVPLANGDVWKPDARMWNMAEGSFDERDAIFAPTPAKITYRLTIPLHASLQFSVTTDNAPGEVAFAVTVTDARGERKEVWAKALGRHDLRKWFDERVDLSAYGGQAVSVELSTTTRTPGTHAENAGAGTGLAMWANPVLLARQPTRVPYNVLWIVVDATRADAIASFHDDAEDAAKRAAPLPPLEALLPKIPGLTPELDALGKKSVRFTHAYSAAPWTRPGTVAMLGGARSTEFGLDSIHWVLPDSEVTRFYASDPPMLPLLLRRQGVVTRAFVNNYFMVGYASVGVDLGFEEIRDYRYRTRDTAEITTHAVEWLKEHKDERYFVFCNYNSPHEPLDPPARFLARVPKPPAGPTDPEAAKYMAEVAKDDEAIGVLMRTLDETGVRDHTIVVMTADHGETLSSAHAGTSALDHMKVRYHHSASNYEETTHVPIILSLPGKLPEDVAVAERARTIDIAPTILDLEGLEPAPKMSGRTLTHLARHEPDGDPRVILSEGRGTHGLLVGNYRLLTREGKAEVVIFGDKEVSMPEELFDLTTDPGERKNLKRSQPDKAKEMRARLDAAIHEVPVAGSGASAPASVSPIAVSLRFAGCGATHRISGSLTVDAGASIVVKPVGLAADSVHGAPRAELSFVVGPDAPVGFDVDVTPSGAALHWELFVDDRKLLPSEVFAGPFGLAAPTLISGIDSDDARSIAFSAKPALVDPLRDFGLFVTRERAAEPEAVGRGKTSAGNEEMRRLMREWGYAHDKGSKE
jgi:arylsulfatase A-like enzyme